MNDRIDIRGMNYRWTDTGDGYFVVHDVGLVAEFAEGLKGAPYKGDKAKLEEFLAVAQKWYKDGSFCARAFKRHNPNPDLPILPADMAGYALPNRIGKYTFPDVGEKWTLFGDVKLDKAHFEEARAGKMPCLSVEINWAENRVSGLAFLDTLDPYYKFGHFTLAEKGESSATAKFEAKPFPKDRAKMEGAAGGGNGGGDGDGGDSAGDGGEGEFAKKYPAVHKKMAAYDAAFGEFASKLGLKFDSLAQKPTALPAEPNRTEGAPPKKEPVHDESQEAKMGMTTDETAKFMALVNDNAEMKGRFLAMERKEKADALLAKVEATLRDKIVSPELKADIAERAKFAASEEKGEEKLLKAIEALKPNLKTKPTAAGEAGAFGGGSGDPAANPIVAKFVGEGHDGAKIARFAAEYREQVAMNPRLTEALSVNGVAIPGLTEEAFIKNCLSHEKYQELKRKAVTTAERG